jgi:GLPGLI family protein
MKIKSVLLMSFVALAVTAQAQNQDFESGLAKVLNQQARTDGANTIDKMQFVATYQCIVKSHDFHQKEVSDSCMMALEVGSRINKFEPQAAFLCDSILRYKKGLSSDQMKTIMENSIIGSTFDMPQVYQNYPLGKMTIRDTFFPNHYVYQENMKAMQWSLSDDTLTVCGYPCKKASARYGGRNWTVWYSEEVPTTAGPWKFNGLPGLIMKAEDSNHLWSMSLVSITKTDIPIAYTGLAKDTKTKRDAFIQFKAIVREKNKSKDGYNPLMSNISTPQIKEITVLHGAVIINDYPPIAAQYHTPVPLDLE